MRQFGLLEPEYAQAVERLGREPNLVELGILGAMWSEHCGYKHSRRLLKLLPTTGPRVLQGPGENAGAVSIGDGLAVALKMESHNHPSAVEPVQGAATGVGGILRDIFTMGARPVAILDSLRFGDPSDHRTPHLVDGVIAGIAFYGNCIGVPTVGGEISFDPSYTGNPLVNAMCVGVLPADRLTRAAASGPGNPLILVGADTGRDGIQGAAFASNDDPRASHRGVIQVGNPFLEKLLLEACLELIERGGVLAMQDLGAAGLTSSSVEMAARGGLGVEIDVQQVPRRETGMNAFEVMLSESQERMLVLVERGQEAGLMDHFAHWGLHAAVIGSITADGTIRIRDGAETVAELPIPLLADDVPAYALRPERPATVMDCTGLDVPSGLDLSHALLSLLGSPNLCSRAYAFVQYDSTVQANTAFGPGEGAAALIRVEGTHKGLAISTDCNPRYMRLDPRRGAQQAVAEAARNVACVGAEPIAVTDCLNFGNPEKPEVAWQLSEAVHGLAEACRALDVPIVSGNVSLYNETAGLGAIAPTPAVGLVGLIEPIEDRVGIGFHEGDAVVLLGQPVDTLSTGELRAVVLGDERGPFPRLDLAAERRLGDLLRSLAQARRVRSAQDVSDGGLAIAVAECALASNVGCRLKSEVLRADGGPVAALFSEDQGRAVVGCLVSEAPAVLAAAVAAGVPARVIGHAGGTRLVAPGLLDVPLAAARAAHESGFARLLGHTGTRV
ncbi:MAG: phosphoribosylformylglycinamidine synthase subunit PurL [Chloroflexi bacterium]|nr:phosphoribosylformylglycinamidine synthase subunit PurL [Chloroflexota bacterium]